MDNFNMRMDYSTEQALMALSLASNQTNTQIVKNLIDHAFHTLQMVDERRLKTQQERIDWIDGYNIGVKSVTDILLARIGINSDKVEV